MNVGITSHKSRPNVVAGEDAECRSVTMAGNHAQQVYSCAWSEWAECVLEVVQGDEIGGAEEEWTKLGGLVVGCGAGLTCLRSGKAGAPLNSPRCIGCRSRTMGYSKGWIVGCRKWGRTTDDEKDDGMDDER